MWQYNHSGRNDWLEHAGMRAANANHKYIKRNFIGGKWVYEYAPNSQGGVNNRTTSMNIMRNNDLKLKRSTAAINQGPKKTTLDTKNGEWSKKHQKTTKVERGSDAIEGAKKVSKAAEKGSVGDKVIDFIANQKAHKSASKPMSKGSNVKELDLNKYADDYVRETGKLKSKQKQLENKIDKITKPVADTAKNLKTNAKIAGQNFETAKDNLGIGIENAANRGMKKAAVKVAAKDLAMTNGGTAKEWEDWLNSPDAKTLGIDIDAGFEQKKKKKYKKFK